MFALNSLHPNKGEYVAFKSDSFRAFYASSGDFEFPIPIGNRLSSGKEGQRWLDHFFQERADAWKQFNSYLVKSGWIGITDLAINREPPLCLNMGSDWTKRGKYGDYRHLLHRTGYLVVGNEISGFARLFDESEKYYRYRRQLGTKY